MLLSRCALFAVIKCRILCRIPFSFRFYCSGRNDYYKTNITRALWLELVGNTQIKQLYTVETFIAIANTIKDKMTALFLSTFFSKALVKLCTTARFSWFRSFSQRTRILGKRHFPDGGKRSEGRILIRCHLEKRWAHGLLARRLRPLCKRNKFLFTLMAYRINARGGLYTRSG